MKPECNICINWSCEFKRRHEMSPVQDCPLCKPCTEQDYLSLRELVAKAAAAYYDDDEPIMSDYDYDVYIHTLQEYEKLHPEYTNESPTQKVGGSTGKSTFEKVNHAIPMLSLQDIFTGNEIEDFLGKFPNEEFSVEEKIDGLSISITYQNGRLVRAETRGDGYIGEDITENAKHIYGIPVRLADMDGADNIKTLEVRCEVYLPVSRFDEINIGLENQGKKTFANPRNAAAGLLRTKDISAVKDAGLRGFAFNVQRIELVDDAKAMPFDVNIHSNLLNYIEYLGFSVVKHYTVPGGDVIKAIQMIGNYRSSLGYWIDGAVVKLEDIQKRSDVGETNKYPRWAVAFKYPPEEKETVVKDIILQTGRTGRITPVAVLEPVILAGTRVEKASLHNPQIIAALGVDIGDTVLVRKAAEIIPEIIKVTKPAYYGEGYEMPKPHYEVLNHQCPSCGGTIEPDEEGNGAYCKNSNCPAQIARRFEFWASRDCMDIRGLGPAQIDKFIELGWLKEIPDIYRLYRHREEMSQLDGFGEKAVDNLLNAIEKSKERDIDRLIKALGMPGIGRHIGKALAQKCDTILTIGTLSEAELSEIDGIGPIAAYVIKQAFLKKDKNGELEMLSMLKQLWSLGVNMKSLSFAQSTDRTLTLDGKTFVITGTLPTLKREEAKDLIEKNGGKVSSSVSKKTDFLLAGEKAGSKLSKAKDLCITIISEEELKDILKLK